MVHNRLGAGRNLGPFFVLALVVIAIWLLSGYLLHGDPQRGTFGDMFGAVNALFSGLAFAGVIYAILLQRDELALQRQELADTRVELQGQKLALNNQNATLARQNFEHSFFQLLALQNEIVNAIDLVPAPDKPPIKGRDCFGTFFRRLLTAHSDRALEFEPELIRVNRAYLNFYSGNQKDLAHYFRSLYHVVKFVDRSAIPASDKRLYTSLIRSHLSSNELLLLFYNCLSDLGREKFKPLIERYGLLKNINFHALLAPTHRALYEDGAYMGSPEHNDGSPS